MLVFLFEVYGFILEVWLHMLMNYILCHVPELIFLTLPPVILIIMAEHMAYKDKNTCFNTCEHNPQ